MPNYKKVHVHYTYDLHFYISTVLLKCKLPPSWETRLVKNYIKTEIN